MEYPYTEKAGGTHLGGVGYPLQAKTSRDAPPDDLQLALVENGPRRLPLVLLFSESVLERVLVDVLETGRAVEVVAGTGSQQRVLSRRHRYGRRGSAERRDRHRYQENAGTAPLRYFPLGGVSLYPERLCAADGDTGRTLGDPRFTLAKAFPSARVGPLGSEGSRDGAGAASDRDPANGNRDESAA